MKTTIVCPNEACGRRIAVPSDSASRKLSCPDCGAAIVVSADATASSSQSPADSSTRREPKSRTTKKIGRFELRRELGRGSFARVYLAHDPVLQREVALKVPRSSVMAGDEELRERFVREWRALAQLSYPNIVPVFDAGSEGGRYFIASAYLPGGTLKELTEERTLDIRESAELVRDLAKALAYAHENGVIHRDVKPSNILLDEDGTPLLSDFGLARLNESAKAMTQDGTVMGTIGYMAPEQASGEQGEVGAASDQYSLGVLLYELLAGHRPFAGSADVVLYNTLRQDPESPRIHNSEIPRDLETICLKTLAKLPADRYESCREFASDLSRWLREEPIHARRQGVVERVGRWCGKNKLVAILATLVVCMIGVGYWLERLADKSGKELAAAKESQEQGRLEKEAATKELVDLKAGAALKQEERDRWQQQETELASEIRQIDDENRLLRAEIDAKQEREKRKRVEISQLKGEASRLSDQLTASSPDAGLRYRQLSEAAKLIGLRQFARSTELLDSMAPTDRDWAWAYLLHCAESRASVLRKYGDAYLAGDRRIVLEPMGRKATKISVYDRSDGKLISERVSEGVQCVSPDGRHFVTWGNDELSLCSIIDGSLVQRWAANERPVTLRMSRDGSCIAGICGRPSEGTTRLSLFAGDGSSRELRQAGLMFHGIADHEFIGNELLAVAYSRGTEGSLVVWDCVSGKPRDQLECPSITEIELHDDQIDVKSQATRRVTSYKFDSTLRKIDESETALLEVVNSSRNVTQLSGRVVGISANAHYAAILDARTIHVVDTRSREKMWTAELRDVSAGWIRCVTIAPDASFIAFGERRERRPGSVRLILRRDPGEIRVAPGIKAWGIKTSRDGQFLAVTYNRKISVLRAADLKVLAEVVAGGGRVCVAFSDEARIYFVAAEKLMNWDWAMSQQPRLLGEGFEARDMEFADESDLVFATKEGLQIVNLQEMQRTAVIPTGRRSDWIGFSDRNRMYFGESEALLTIVTSQSD